MRTYKIFLVRHGLTMANIEARYVGATDVDLCEQGVAEILELKEKYDYPNVGRVYSSPLKRTLQTARLIYPDITPVTVNGLSEYNFGEFENKTIDELKDNERFIKWMHGNREERAEGAETMQEFQKRVVVALDDVIMDMMKDKMTCAAVVTHGGVIMSLLELCGLPKSPSTAWSVGNGMGFTLMINASLWGNNKAFEIFTPIPYGADIDSVHMDYQKYYGVSANEDELDENDINEYDSDK